MVDAKSTDLKDVFDLMEKRSAIGVALEILNTSPAVRSKEKYQEVEKKIAVVPVGTITSDDLQAYIKDILEYEEVILVIFRKLTTNEKVGHKEHKEFKKGLSYYISRDTGKYYKVYVHWQEEKKFLLENIACLNSPSFIVEKQTFNYIPNVSSCNISLYNEKMVYIAECTLYFGYKE